MSDNRDKAAMVAERIFTDGFGRRPKRLVMEYQGDGDKLHSIGWCEAAIAAIIREAYPEPVVEFYREASADNTGEPEEFESVDDWFNYEMPSEGRKFHLIGYAIVPVNDVYLETYLDGDPADEDVAYREITKGQFDAG